MRYSMTGFSKIEQNYQNYNISIEIKSLNHRHLEIKQNLPSNLRSLEIKIRQQISNQIKRGKIDLWLNINNKDNQNYILQNQLISYYFDQLNKHPVAKNLPPINWQDLLSLPDVFTEKTPIELDENTIFSLINQAINQLNQSRKEEGKKIYQVLLEKLDVIQKHIYTIKQQLPQLQHKIHTKIHNQIDQLIITIDQNRLEQEIMHYLQRIDIAEEIDRLFMHIANFRTALNKEGSIGRRLDFVSQELHREANTLGAKIGDAEVVNLVVEIKVLIEQLREQVQNLE